MQEDTGPDQKLMPSPEGFLEFELNKIARSGEPINLVEGEKKPIEDIKTAGSYSVVLVEGAPNIVVYDPEAVRRSQFESKSGRATTINWGVVSSLLGVTRVFQNDYRGPSRSDEKRVNQLPPSLQEPANELLVSQKEWGRYISILDLVGTKKASQGELEVVENGRYVIYFDQGGKYKIAFVVKDSQGQVMLPRNWTRIEQLATLDRDIPQDLKRHLRDLFLQDSETHRVPFNEDYEVETRENGLSIYQTRAGQVELFADQLYQVEENVCFDPQEKDVLYYCTSLSPREIYRLDLKGDPGSWRSQPVKLVNQYPRINNLRLDPTGAFFVFDTGTELVILEKETLTEVKREPNLSHVQVDVQGKIHAVDKDGHLVIYQPDFSSAAEEWQQARTARALKELDVQALVRDRLGRVEKPQVQRDLAAFEPKKNETDTEFRPIIDGIGTLEDADRARTALDALKQKLVASKVSSKGIAFITGDVDAAILAKEKELAIPVVEQALKRVQQRLDIGLSLATIGPARTSLDRARSLIGLVEEPLRDQIRLMEDKVASASGELFRREAVTVQADLDNLLTGVEGTLKGFSSKAEMENWLDSTLPHYKVELGRLLREVPVEAVNAHEAIIQARERLVRLADEYERMFREEYRAVREGVVVRAERTVGGLRQDVFSLMQRLQDKGFTERGQAERYLATSPAREALAVEIEVLSRFDPEPAIELQRLLKAQTAAVLGAIERGVLRRIAETGQIMTRFGQIDFPVWEGKVAKKGERRVELTFSADEKSKGPGVGADQIMGDVGLIIRRPDSTTEKVRLWEGFEAEDDYRYGLRGRRKILRPSYLSATEYQEIQQNWQDWRQGEKSALRKAYQEKKEAVEGLLQERQKAQKKRGKLRDDWQEAYNKVYQEFVDFRLTNYTPFLRRIDQVREAPEIEKPNGKGQVAPWESHWTRDAYTEKHLEEIAELLKMQIALQEGCVNLRGHTGTGKDVLVKMISAATNRPLFIADCSKWTTEYELAADIQLQVKDGASYTVELPSAVLLAMRTPGAILYFNEINNMPEQAQIFLHALLDEKRTITLKTRSGEQIKADPSLLIFSSENPDYPGTFTPGFATRRRFIDHVVDYVPWLTEPDKNDPNKNQRFNPAEALRVARNVASLSDFTWDENMERNEFVRIWERYVNGVENGAPELNQVQKVDLEVIQCLVQFGHQLRTGFINKIERRPEARGFSVSQPITGGELRRCAWDLSQMSPEQKSQQSAEEIAKTLLEKHFLTHIFDAKERETIKQAMQQWSKEPRLRS